MPRRKATTPRHETLGEALVRKKICSPEQVEEALRYQEKYGGRIGWILLSLGYVSRLDLFEELKRVGCLRCDTDITRLIEKSDVRLLKEQDSFRLLELEAIPHRLRGGKLTVVTAYPRRDILFEYFSRSFKMNAIEMIVVTNIDFIRMANHFFSEKYTFEAINQMLAKDPGRSASRVFTKGQVLVLGVLIFLILTGLYASPLNLMISITVFVQIFYAVSVAFKFLVGFTASKNEMKQPVTQDELSRLDEKNMPVYTILIPVFKEPEVIGTLVEGLKDIDYPKNKLDVIFLLEEIDTETLEAAKTARPPAHWRFLIIPDSQPRTKPKACNYGLFFAKGEYLVIYDVEDLPEPDQLKKAIVSFRKNPEEYVCFQGQLNYFNKDENFLTRMFTLEYSYWFDYMLPGLDRLRLPIPLGGSSNHFKTARLKELLAWDPFNVTEDADLGMRASAKGLRVGVINSTTYEEADSKLKNWIRQRSRWIKGYLQTWLVYTRNPPQNMREVGLKNWLGFNLLIGGTCFTYLINPVLWVMFIAWVITMTTAFEPLFPPYVLYISLFSFLIGNSVMVHLAMLAVFRRRYWGLLPYALLNPVYWVLHSVAAYKALWELFAKPFYWQKTKHGLTNQKPVGNAKETQAG